MEIETNRDISLLDQVKIQAQVLLPVLRALRKEIGEQRANELVAGALREWSRETFLKMGASRPGTPRDRWAALTAESVPRIGGDIDFEMLEQTPEVMDFNATGCRYAEFFRQLGEPDLGGVLLCETDLHVAEVGAPEVELRRTQTIMKGAKYCDFRYRMKAAAKSK